MWDFLERNKRKIATALFFDGVYEALNFRDMFILGYWIHRHSYKPMLESSELLIDEQKLDSKPAVLISSHYFD